MTSDPFVFCTFGADESVRWTLNLKVPAAVGVPLMTPVEESSERPGGTCPDEFQWYGDVSPVASMGSVYGCPTVAAGRLVVVMESPETSIWRSAVAGESLGSPSSVTFATNAKSPPFLGVPASEPFELSSLTPGGSFPPAWDHSKGPTPPLMPMVAE